MVKINDVTYDYIIDTEYTGFDDSHLPEWLNNNADINDNFWNKKTKKISYTLRLNDSQKWEIEQLLKAHSYIYLYDDIQNKYFIVMITSISSKYIIAENYLYPWMLTVDLIVAADSSEYLGFQIQVFSSEFERIFL